MPEPTGPFFPIFQVDEIAFAMSLFVSAASLKIPRLLIQESRPSSPACGRLFHSLMEIMPPAGTLGVNDESTLRYAFTALWAHYEGDIRQKSICARVFGFHRLMILTRGALVADWVVSPDDGPEIILLHPAVVTAVAMTRLSESGAMVRPEFLRTFEMATGAETQLAA